MIDQPSVSYQHVSPNRDPNRLVNARIEAEVLHPDFGLLKAGEVVTVTLAYADEWERMGVAWRTDAVPTRAPIEAATGLRCLDCGGTRIGT